MEKVKVTVNAILEPKEGHAEQLFLELKKVQQASREEEGCIQYNIHQSVDTNTFVLYEVWKDQDAVDSHAQTAHYQEYRKNTAEHLSSREVYRLKLIED